MKTGIYLIIFLSCCHLSFADYYQVLGIKKNADTREIRKAFKAQALKMHPDKNQGNPEAHENFLELNKAYEVLKDSEMRKKYDTYGEKGLKDDFGSGWTGNFHSWNYYYESFGIYDDDPEIVTLSGSEFDRSVLGVDVIWFINFYSPQCSHCHQLAPAWRRMARTLEGVVRVGAVNCEEDRSLCHRFEIRSYPNLVLFPKKLKYNGHRGFDDLVEFVLKQIPNPYIVLNTNNFEKNMNSVKSTDLKWLIYFSVDSSALDKDEMKKFAFIVKDLFNLGIVTCSTERSLCKKLKCSKNAWVVFEDLKPSGEFKISEEIIAESPSDLYALVQKHVPSLPVFEAETFKSLIEFLKESLLEHSFLFLCSESSDSGEIKDIIRLKSKLNNVKLGRLDCKVNPVICQDIHLKKLPSFVMVRQSGAYEIFHGEATVYNLEIFVKETLESVVETLEPHHFPGTVVHSQKPWFVDFFAPWCPPCMNLLPEWRKASKVVGHLVNFGTVDCTAHPNLCRSYDINSYPTTILFNNTIPHRFHGTHSSQALVEFVEDTLKPIVVELTPSLFASLVEGKNQSDIWAVDFFMPWCAPCQKLGPHWRKMAKQVTKDEIVHIGQVDCQAQKELCQNQGINSYPTLRVYPQFSKNIKDFSTYNGWNRDSESLKIWVQSFLPTYAVLLSSNDFFQDVLPSGRPWVVNFFAPWCGHCRMLEPTYERIAKDFQLEVNIGKINCVENSRACHDAGVDGYPTIKFYSGSKDGNSQAPWGEEISTQKEDGIRKFIRNKVPETKTKGKKKDEL